MKDRSTRHRTALALIVAVLSTAGTASGQETAPVADSALALHVPYVATVDELQAAIAQQLFPQGKYYFCRGASCDGFGHDLYLEYPVVRLAGARLELQAHLAGNYYVFPLRPGVSATVTASAVPRLSDGVLTLDHPTVRVQSENLVVRSVQSTAISRLEDVLRDVSVPVRQRIAHMALRYVPRNTFAVDGVCYELGIGGLEVLGLRSRPELNGIEIALRAVPQPAAPTRCVQVKDAEDSEVPIESP